MILEMRIVYSKNLTIGSSTRVEVSHSPDLESVTPSMGFIGIVQDSHLEKFYGPGNLQKLALPEVLIDKNPGKLG